MKQLLLTALSAVTISLCHAQEAPSFSSIQPLANREISLQLNATAGKGWQLQFSTNNSLWLPVTTMISTGANNYADSRAPYLPVQLYRAAELSETNLLTGDHIQTSEGEVLIHPIDHASFLMTW